MAFLRSILWVPMVFGVIMGSLAIARLIANGLGAEFVAMPGQNAYLKRLYKYPSLSHYRRYALGIMTLIVLLNPLLAAGLLWWNAAEIARLSAGIG